MTPIPITQVCYVRLGTTKAEQTARFASDILGLQRTSGIDHEIAFRSDHLAQRVCIVPSEQDGQSVGVELPDDHCMERAKAALATAGFPVREAGADECRRRRVHGGLIAQDGSGNTIELIIRPAHSGRRYFPSRDAGITGLQGIGLRSTNIERDLVFWTKILGARVSDRVGDITYLRIDDLHHRIALYPSRHNGLLEVCFAVEAMDSLMQNRYFLLARQIAIVHGPGKESASDQIFIRFPGPTDCLFSYTYGMRTVRDRERPRQFLPNAGSLCAWGSECTNTPELQLPG